MPPSGKDQRARGWEQQCSQLLFKIQASSILAPGFVPSAAEIKLLGGELGALPHPAGAQWPGLVNEQPAAALPPKSACQGPPSPLWGRGAPATGVPEKFLS